MCLYNMMSTAFSLVIIGLLTPLTEQLNITCGNTSQQTEVQCTCYNSGGQGVAWLRNDIAFTTCLKSFDCTPSQIGYTFSKNSSADLYFLTINSLSYSQCGIYECRDLSSPSIMDTFEISITDTYPDLSLEPEVKTEPGNHTDGNFSVTTTCLFNVNNVEIKWYTVSNGSKIPYVPEISSTTHIKTSCQACKNVTAAKIQTSFLHKESKAKDKTLNEVSFVLEMYDNQNLSNNNSIQFLGLYTIFGTNSSETNPDTSPVPPVPDPECRCWIIIIIIIVITRLQYAQIWLSGYSLYRGRNTITDFKYVQCVETILILLTGLPVIGLISCTWAYFKSEQGKTYPKWLKWALAAGFIVGCVQPGFGLFITGAAYATYVQNGRALLCTTVMFILLVGGDVALTISCTVLKIEWYYYIVISAGYLLVWITVVVIMIKCGNKLCIKHGTTAVPQTIMETITTKESKERTNVSGKENLNVDDCTCDLCGQHVMHTLKGFCLERSMFLCNSCLSKHKCKGKHLKHNQHDERGREKYFPCERKQKTGHRNLPAHGYCLECMLYLCTECLIDHNKHELLWMPHHDAKTFDDICCFKTRTDRNNTIPLGYCKTCKMYICEECTSRHNEAHNKEPHIIIFHQHNETQTSTKKCSECPNPMECYKLNVNKYLCADCYDSDSLWTKNTSWDEYSKTIVKESKKCQLHHEVGDSPANYSPTDVFCIVCSLYMCKECFKVHRRFRERWIATHRENLFTCKGCQEKNNVFPVECFCIKSKSFLCAVCFEDSKMTSKHATKKYLRPETITQLSNKPDCELHKVPFQFEDTKEPSTVYCLLCKTYMCDKCFKKHLRLKEAWAVHQKEMKSTCQKQVQNNEVSQIRV